MPTRREALPRLEPMITMGGFALPSKTIKEMVVGSIDIIIQAARLRDGSRRITHITEVVGMEGDVVITQDLFLYDIIGEDADGRVMGRHRSTGIARPHFWIAPAIMARRTASPRRWSAPRRPTMLELALIGFIALSVGGFLVGLLYPWLTGEAQAARRVQTISDKSARRDSRPGLRARLMAESKDSRRKQIQESLKQLEETERKRRRRLTLRTLLMQSGLDLSVQKFWVASIVFESCSPSPS